MGMIDLLRKESLSGKRMRNVYKIGGSPVDFCGKLMNINGFSKDKVRLTIEGEEMKPDKKVIISSFAELLPFTKKSNVSSCLFKGLYNGEPVEILVDFGMKMLNVVAEDTKAVDMIKKALEDK